jgi:hypothetical protein
MTLSKKIQIAGGAWALLAMATTAQAGSADGLSRLAPALGNTIVSTHPDGRKARLWLGAGGTYRAQGRDGGRSGGTWSVKGDKLCLTEHHPLPIPIPYCKPIPAETVGKPWRDRAVNGDQVTNEIVRGKADAAS